MLKVASYSKRLFQIIDFPNFEMDTAQIATSHEFMGRSIFFYYVLPKTTKNVKFIGQWALVWETPYFYDENVT